MKVREIKTTTTDGALSKYAPYLRPTWWTVSDAANLICGFCPPEEKFDMDLFTGGDRALLYFELKNLFIAEGQQASGKHRIRPAVALRVATGLKIKPPKELVPLLTEDVSGTSRARGQHVSEKLSFLNQAADRFWGNAKQDDPDTHPKSRVVAEWLETKGYTPTLAEKAASIIRPDWAFKGRPENPE
jgi:hypothetical protein